VRRAICRNTGFFKFASIFSYDILVWKISAQSEIPLDSFFNLLQSPVTYDIWFGKFERRDAVILFILNLFPPSVMTFGLENWRAERDAAGPVWLVLRP
jgi:hypothetical protein